MLVRTTFALIALTSVAAAAPAPTQTVTRETLKQYCTGDYLTYCGNFAPDSDEVKACFKQNKAKLSTNCQAAITAYSKGQKRAER